MATLSPKKILIRTPNWLGDLMMATAFLNKVLHQFSEAQVDLIVKKGFEHLPLPHRGSIYIYDRRLSSPGAFGASLRSEQYDRIYILPPSFSSAWMGFQSGAKERIGYVGNWRQWLLNSAKPYNHPPRTIHLVYEYLALLDNTPHSKTTSFNEPSLETQYSPQIVISKEWVEEQLQNCEVLPDCFIAITTGAIYGPAKQWPITHFQALTKLLIDHKYQVVFVGTLEDRNAVSTIERLYPTIHNWCGKTTLPQLVALLSKASLLVSNDSGSMHIMAALQRPQVAVFGSTNPNWTGPLNVQADTLYLNFDCSPCYKKTCSFGHYACLQNIKPEQVFKKIQARLS